MTSIRTWRTMSERIFPAGGYSETAAEVPPQRGNNNFIRYWHILSSLLAAERGRLNGSRQNTKP